MEGEPIPPLTRQEPEPVPDAEERDPEEIAPRIYVASLADYNAGRLHGAWLDATLEPEQLHDRISQMLARSPETIAEEWAIHDFEGFNGLHLGEWEDLAHVSRVAQGIAEHGLAFAHWTTLAASDDDLDHFQDAYRGHWPSLTAYAEELLEDLGLDRTLDEAVPDGLRSYVTIDAEAFGRDLDLSGDITAIDGEGGVYVFDSTW